MYVVTVWGEVRELIHMLRSYYMYVVTGDDDNLIVGGTTDADENNPRVIEAAKFAVSNIDATDNSDNALRLVRMSAISKVICGSTIAH